MSLPCIAAVVFALNVGKKTFVSNEAVISPLISCDIEALSNCESVDGQKNNGHCTQNDRLEYFCEKPGLFNSRNCLQ